jgi:hypothetical protein
MEHLSLSGSASRSLLASKSSRDERNLLLSPISAALLFFACRRDIPYLLDRLYSSRCAFGEKQPGIVADPQLGGVHS